MGCSKSSSKRQVYSNTILPQETRKTLNRQQQNRQTDKSTKLEMKKNTPSSQVHMEYSPEQITSWDTNQTSVNLRKSKSYQASSPTTMLRLDINYKKKPVRKTNTWRCVKQHVSK